VLRTGQFYWFSVKIRTVLQVFCEELDSSTGSLLRVLRAGQLYRFSMKSRTALQVLCCEWDSSTGSFVKSGAVLQVSCEQ
jgi:3-methyladenine DNA glycosylase Mpg